MAAPFSCGEVFMVITRILPVIVEVLRQNFYLPSGNAFPKPKECVVRMMCLHIIEKIFCSQRFPKRKQNTKGNHIFVVCTYIDKSHIHNHIIWDSVIWNVIEYFIIFGAA